MRLLLLSLISLLFLGQTSAQEKVLIIQGTSPNLYLSHSVIPKENYYSIGRLYNVAPKDLAAYNKLQFEKGLIIGENIKIPLTHNFTQTDSATEKLTPVYHIVEPKETLSRVSLKYKVSPALIKKWNKLKTDAVNKDAKLIVGYLKVAKGSSSLLKETKVPTDTAVKKERKKLPVKDSVVIPDTKQAVIEPKKEEIKTEVKEQPKETTAVTNQQESVFKKTYDEQSKGKTEVKEAGNSGIFKSTSGWQDGKYYCFHNSAPQGTIIKITNNATGKSIYAKVLDIMPDIKQNEGLLIQLSNAGAEQLGASGNKFECSISYFK
jgi:LysM repeat protein